MKTIEVVRLHMYCFDNGLVMVHASSAGFLGPFVFTSVHKYSKVVDTVIL